MALGREEPPPFLYFARFHLYLRVLTPMELPPYKGAVFRGAFGTILRRLVCVTRQSDCRPCLLRERCLYIALFDPPPPPGFLESRKFQKAPRPYVLTPPLTPRRSFRTGETLDFDLVLLGPAIEALPYFIHIFMEMGRQGLGQRRLGREWGKYELIQVDFVKNGSARPIYEKSTRTLTNFAPESGPVYLPEDEQATSLTLDFLTPLRLKRKGDLVTSLSFPFFFECLARRLSVLAAFYGDACQLVDFSSLAAAADEVQVTHSRLRWFDWERYSRRQQAEMKFGGLKGRVQLAGKLGPLLPILRLGSQVNAGEKTTFGLGRYEISGLSSV